MPERFTPPPPTRRAGGAGLVRARSRSTPRGSSASRRLTFNAHRIHYDLPYATEVEKYPGLVVHGPLQAILLMQAARRHRNGAWPAGFSFRGCARCSWPTGSR